VHRVDDLDENTRGEPEHDRQTEREQPDARLCSEPTELTLDQGSGLDGQQPLERIDRRLELNATGERSLDPRKPVSQESNHQSQEGHQRGHPIKRDRSGTREDGFVIDPSPGPNNSLTDRQAAKLLGRPGPFE
jgi:hypothetical protein